MCHTCRQEQWYARHADELEFLMLVKGYTLAIARVYIMDMSRPICQWCHRPIKGANEKALFHKGNNFKLCRSAALKFSRLCKGGLTTSEALARVRRGSR